MPDSELSFSAQTVLTAVTQQEYCLDPCDIPNEAGRIGYLVAAALRAAADTLLDHDYWHGYVTGWDNKPAIFYRRKLLAIADELEGVKYGTYRCDLEDKPQ